MTQQSIKNTIHRKLYEAYFLGDGTADLNLIREEEKWDEDSLWKAADRMTHDGTVQPWASTFYKITSLGVIRAEDERIVPEELAKNNQHIRTVALDELAKAYETPTSSGDADIGSISTKLGIDLNLLVNNLQVLEDLDYIEPVAGTVVKITHKGLDAVEDWRKRSAIADEFDQIAALNPQARGRALQKLFARVVEQHGWSQEEGLRTSNEEMDVIVYRLREYYLVECKWEKDPIQADVVRELYGKLSNRVDVRGMIISMSGFTEGAVKQVGEYAGQRVIMLFGPENVRTLIHGRVSFEELLNAKYKELVTLRKVIFS
jgi:hypothetical protein